MTLAAVLVLFSGCSRKLKKTTTFYSLDFSHSLNYIRLGSDGNYTDSIGLSGTYEIDGDKIVFSEETGSTYNGYMTDSYLYYFAYDGNDQKIPEGNSFDVQAYDGKRTTIYFSADGSVKEHIYQQGIYDFEINGKYSRDGNLITCTYGSQGIPEGGCRGGSFQFPFDACHGSKRGRCHRNRGGGRCIHGDLWSLEGRVRIND